MFIRRPTVLAVALSFAAPLLLACGGPAADAGPAARPEAGPAQAPGAQKARKHNACDLVDREEIDRIAGKKLNALHNLEDTDQTTCEFYDPELDDPVVSVKVFWKGGKELARVEQAAMGMAKQAFGAMDADIAELTGSGKVKGLADGAFYSDVLPSWMLKGDVLIQVIAPLWNHEKTLGTFKSVARSALPKL